MKKENGLQMNGFVVRIVNNIKHAIEILKYIELILYHN